MRPRTLPQIMALSKLRRRVHACMQVNASPSLTSTTPSDRLLKARVIHDTLRLATPPEWDPHSPMPALTTQDGPSNKSLQAEREGMSSAPGRGTGSPVMSRTASLRSQTSLRGSRCALFRSYRHRLSVMLPCDVSCLGQISVEKTASFGLPARCSGSEGSCSLSSACFTMNLRNPHHCAYNAHV